MWQMLSPAFHEIAKANGMDTPDKRAVLWAGFLASYHGAMAADQGFDTAAMISDQVKKALVDAARSMIK
jgi:hypothetical protein